MVGSGQGNADCRFGLKALAVITRIGADGRVELLCDHGRDASVGRNFYRLPGGGIEFGERACEAMVREVREELGCACEIERSFGWWENIFHYNGVPGHQMVAVFAVSLADASVYARDEVAILDYPGKTQVWVPYADMMMQGGAPLYPEGIEALIGDWVASKALQLQQAREAMVGHV